MVDNTAWLPISVLVHLKRVWWGSGQGSEWASRVLSSLILPSCRAGRQTRLIPQSWKRRIVRNIQAEAFRFPFTATRKENNSQLYPSSTKLYCWHNTSRPVTFTKPGLIHHTAREVWFVMPQSTFPLLRSPVAACFTALHLYFETVLGDVRLGIGDVYQEGVGAQGFVLMFMFGNRQLLIQESVRDPRSVTLCLWFLNKFSLQQYYLHLIVEYLGWKKLQELTWCNCGFLLLSPEYPTEGKRNALKRVRPIKHLGFDEIKWLYANPKMRAVITRSCVELINSSR